ncbi:MAG TPA: hypothetical protein VFF33_12460 [Ignavibacteriaceae bacterium]|nr:hypothetical protein [Ignavibacteriaceae bacterium]
MKFLAIEKEIKKVDWGKEKEILEEEARGVYKLYSEGYIREIYFNEFHNAVIILESENLTKANDLLATLPLVKNKLITFEVMKLNPYTGWERMFG